MVCFRCILLFVQMPGTFLRDEDIKSPDPRPDWGESERSKNAIFEGCTDWGSAGYLF